MKNLIFSVAILLCLHSWTRAGDRSASPVLQWIAKTPMEVVPLEQKDDFSCGYLALAAIYESYGLDPKLARLRERLGTSVPAIPFLESSTGTLQPDLFRVLQQDGFEALTVDPKKSNEFDELLEHLEGPHYALALVTTEKAGGYHWIVLTDFDGGEFTIADSLVEGLHQKSLPEFAGPRFLQAILLSPGVPDPDGPFGKAHYSGSWRLLQSLPDPVLVVGVVILLIGSFLAFLVLRFFLRRATQSGSD